MSMTRSIARNIARNRLIDAGYERPNKRLGMTSGGGKNYIQTIERSRRGRKNSRKRRAFIESIRKSDPQVWRRVLYGDLSKKIGLTEAWKRASLKRALLRQTGKVHRGEAWQTAGAAK